MNRSPKALTQVSLRDTDVMETLKACGTNEQALSCALPRPPLPRVSLQMQMLHQQPASILDFCPPSGSQTLCFLVPPSPWQLPPGSFSHPLYIGSHPTPFTPHGPRGTSSLKWKVVMRIK